MMAAYLMRSGGHEEVKDGAIMRGYEVVLRSAVRHRLHHACCRPRLLRRIALCNQLPCSSASCRRRIWRA